MLFDKVANRNRLSANIVFIVFSVVGVALTSCGAWVLLGAGGALIAIGSAMFIFSMLALAINSARPWFEGRSYGAPPRPAIVPPARARC